MFSDDRAGVTRTSQTLRTTQTRRTTRTLRTTRTVRAAGRPIRVTIENEGAGEPLLLINGIGATGDLFDPLRLHLRDRETIAFDAPGVGGSPTPFMPYTMRHMARVTADLVGELGHDQVDVLGLSWGGALAQQFARSHPATVRRLVLAATMPGVTSVPGRPAAMLTLMSPLRYQSPEYLKRIAPTLYGGAIRSNPELLDEHARQRSARPPTVLGYTYQMSAIQRWTSLPWLHCLSQPTLVLAGDDDPIARLVNARIMARLIPDSRLHVVDGGGHLFLFTQAAAMADIIGDFLDSGASKARRQVGRTPPR